MIHRTSRVARGLLSLLIALGRWLAEAAPLIAAAACFGALLGFASSLTQPRLFAAESVVSLEPEVFGQGTVLSMQGLVQNYAVQLRSRGLIERALVAAGRTESPERVRAATFVEGDPEELTIAIRVLAPGSGEAVGLARAILDQFRRELEAANRRLDRNDRLRMVVLEPPWSAVAVSPRFRASTAAGAAAGLLAGLAGAGLRTRRRRTTFSRPLEVECFLGAPTLGAIPRRR